MPWPLYFLCQCGERGSLWYSRLTNLQGKPGSFSVNNVAFTAFRPFSSFVIAWMVTGPLRRVLTYYWAKRFTSLQAFTLVLNCHRLRSLLVRTLTPNAQTPLSPTIAC